MADIDIDKLMASLGPFERPPLVAVAVSGGSDSLGLGLLLADWVRDQGGRLRVLSVDHGLRADSAAECARVSATFAAIPGCSAHVLRWEGSKPAHGLQATARRARYALLTDWCRSHGVLHLAIAHTADDQAETVAMRRAHGSGPIGLAGMAAVRPEAGVRLLRPLLSTSRETIRSWLRARGQEWIEDPSNEQPKFERVRIRRDLDAGKMAALNEEARGSGSGRDRLERVSACLLAEAGTVHEAGYISVGLEALQGAAPEVRAATLRQVILAGSGEDYAPDLESLLSSLEMRGGVEGWTRAGCLVRTQQGRLWVFREAAACGGRVPVSPGWAGGWDNRFRLQVARGLAGGPGGSEGWSVGVLGEEGLRQAADRFRVRMKRHPIPLPARMALPALWQGEHLICQPHLNLGEGLAAKLAPRHTVTTCGFTVAAERPHTIYSPSPC